MCRHTAAKKQKKIRSLVICFFSHFTNPPEPPIYPPLQLAVNPQLLRMRERLQKVRNVGKGDKRS